LTFALTLTKDFVILLGMSSALPRPTEAELPILQVLWDRGPLSVRDVMHALNELKPTGYTTVLKQMQIMTDKGLVEKDESQRPQIYRASCSQTQTQRQLLSHLVQRAFGGSVKSMVLQALSSRKSTPEEIAEVEKLLDRMEKGRMNLGRKQKVRTEGEEE
jgi:BlaI family transcriptional regulator, penicillinase repressor